MSNAHTPSSEVRRIEAAAAFSTRLTERRQETSAELEAWLADDPENARVWARRQQTWALFDQNVAAPELLDLRRRALNEARGAGRRRWNAGQWKSWAVAAGVGALAVAGGAFWRQALPETYATSAGEQRTVTLPDGSRMQLDARTKVRVDYSPKARELVLVAGQARFEVAADIVRPFSVVAAGSKVVALGTAFNVDLLGKEVRVTLIEGRVAVVDERSGAKDAAPIELKPGQQLQVTQAHAPRIVEANVQRTTAWQGGKLVFDNEPLALVAERVSRYTDRKVSVADPATGALRMSGVFDAGDLKTFLTSVTGYLDVEARETEGGFLLMQGQ